MPLLGATTVDRMTETIRNIGSSSYAREKSLYNREIKWYKIIQLYKNRQYACMGSMNVQIRSRERSMNMQVRSRKRSMNMQVRSREHSMNVQVHIPPTPLPPTPPVPQKNHMVTRAQLLTDVRNF